MNMIRKSLPLLVLVLFASCNKEADIRSQLIGEWENTSLNVQMNSVDGSDSTSQLVANDGEWENVLGIKPIKTSFNADGTFTSSYFNLEGEPLGEEEGEWEIIGDSLILKSQSYASAYHITVKENKARFVAYLDWDQDGAEDDLYDGWQKRIPIQPLSK